MKETQQSTEKFEDIDCLCGLELKDIFPGFEEETQSPVVSEVKKEIPNPRVESSEDESSSYEFIPTLSDVVHCDVCEATGDKVCLQCYTVLCANPMCTVSHQCCERKRGEHVHEYPCSVPQPGGALPLEVEGGPTLQQSRTRFVVSPKTGDIYHVKDLQGINSVEEAVVAGMADPLVIPVPPGEDALMLTEYVEHLQTQRRAKKPRSKSAPKNKKIVQEDKRSHQNEYTSKMKSQLLLVQLIPLKHPHL